MRGQVAGEEQTAKGAGTCLRGPRGGRWQEEQAAREAGTGTRGEGRGHLVGGHVQAQDRQGAGRQAGRQGARVWPLPRPPALLSPQRQDERI